MKGYILLIFSLFCLNQAWANDTPNHPLHSQNESNVLYPDCNLASSGEMLCDFTQIYISKVDPNKIDEQITNSKNQCKKEMVGKRLFDDDSDDESCDGMIALGKYLRNEITKENAEAVLDTDLAFYLETKLSTPELIETFLLTSEYVELLCKKEMFTEEDCHKLADFEAKKLNQNCNISTHRFSETFIPSKTNQNVYVSNSGPNGLCGVINVTTLTTNSDYGILWTYKTQKIVTNPSGGISDTCAMLDTNEAIFDWKPSLHTEDYALNCKTISYK